MNSPFSTLLFDLDGTLIDSRADLTSAVNHALAGIGHPALPQEKVLVHVGNGMKRLIHDVVGRVSEAEFEKALSDFETYYGAHCVDKTTLYPGVKPVLNEFKERFKLAVVTNKPAGFSKKILETLGVAELLSVVIGGDSTPYKKPHPAPVLAAIEKSGGTLEGALLVGDGSQDLEAAQSIGVRTCLVKYGYGYNPGLEALKPNFLITSFEKLKEIVL